MTKIVVQEEPTGCGIACVAMIAGRTYAEVKEIANAQGIYAEDEELFTATKYVRKLLSDFNVKISEVEQPFSSWEAMPDKALLATKYRVENDCARWHWSVYISNPVSVLDPAAYLSENIRKDFDHISVKWFISCE